MNGPGHIHLPPDIDFSDPEVDTLCHYCGSVEVDGWDGERECVVCEPRCLLEDTPLRCNGFVIEEGRVRAVEVCSYCHAGDPVRRNGEWVCDQCAADLDRGDAMDQHLAAAELA